MKGVRIWREQSDRIWDGSNESLFSALPGGGLSPNGGYFDLNSYVYFWTSSEQNNLGWSRFLGTGRSDVSSGNSPKNSGFSVRCIQD